MTLFAKMKMAFELTPALIRRREDATAGKALTSSNRQWYSRKFSLSLRGTSGERDGESAFQKNPPSPPAEPERFLLD